MMKYKISYKNLLLNTLLDAMKREDRRTIDGTDIINYENVLKEISRENEIDLSVEDFDNYRSFVEGIDPFVCIIENKNVQTYTLLPWISIEEFEESLENTIFVDMGPVDVYSSDALRFKRDCREIYELKEISYNVGRQYLKMTEDSLCSLEQQMAIENARYVKIKSTLNMK